MKAVGNRLWPVALILLALVSFSPITSAATRDIHLEISPLPILLSTTPGKSTTTDLRVRNVGSSTEKLKVTLRKFKSDNNGNVEIVDRQSGDDYFDWVNFDKTTFDAPTNEWQTIHMTINPPKDAAFGYYYAVQYSRTQEATAEPGTAALQGAVVTFVLLDVQAPGAKREVKVADFSTAKTFYEFLPVDFNVKIQNTGNIHLAPRGNIFITQGGKDVTTLDVNTTQGNVLPSSSRTFLSSWSDGFPVYVEQSGTTGKDGKPVRKLKWDFSKAHNLRFGKYTAKLLLVYDDGKRDVPIESTLNFWVIPWRLIGGLLLVIILVLIGLHSTVARAYRRLFKHRQR